MTDPRRLLEDHGLTGDERTALVAAQSMQPPEGLVESSWAALASALGIPPGAPPTGGAGPAAAGGAGAAGTAAGGGATSLLGKLAAVSIAKAVGIGAAVGGIVTTAVVSLPASSSRPELALSGGSRNEQYSSAPPAEARPVPRAAFAAPAATARAVLEAAPTEALATPSVSAVLAAPPNVEAPSGRPVIGQRAPKTVRPDGVVAAGGVAAAEVATPGLEPGSPPSVAAFESPYEVPPSGPVRPVPSAAPAPSVQEEARLVGRARGALRAGDAALALQMLNEGQARFPIGALRQESEALAIEALVRLGRRDSAEGRAARFVRDFPGSPYIARVQGLVRTP